MNGKVLRPYHYWPLCSALPTELTGQLGAGIAPVSQRSWVKSRTGLNLFKPYFQYCSRSVHYCEDRFHIHVFIHSSHIWLSYIHSHLLIASRVYVEPTHWPARSWLISRVGRALHRYRRGHEFKSRTGLYGITLNSYWLLVLFPIFPTASFDNFEWRGKFLKKLWCSSVEEYSRAVKCYQLNW